MSANWEIRQNRIIDDEGDTICGVFQSGIKYMNLIATSPKLLEVCEEVLDLDWAPHGGDPGECMSMCPVCQVLDKLENIVKEAKGLES